MAQQQQPAGEGGANPLLPPRKLIITKAKNINIQKQKSGEEGGGGLGGIGGEAQPPLQQQPRLQLQLQLQQEGPTTNISSSSPGRFRQDPINFLLKLSSESSAFLAGAGWRAYVDYVGSPIMYPEYTHEMRKAILGSNRVREAVDRVVLARLATAKRQPSLSYSPSSSASSSSSDPAVAALKRQIWKDCMKTVDGMIAEMDSIRFIRFFAFVVNNILVRMYHQGIHIQEPEFLQVRRAAEYAFKNKISLIFLPCHKSHIDYLVISYVFYRLGLALPHIAAGDNLNMPVVGNILKHGGAFFIKRQWGNDPIYLAIMREYIETLLEKGHNIEAFIEGTRSRIGKLLQPKFGILKIILESILTGTRVKDAVIVPMSIGYDRVIESAGYVNELLGTPKEKESLVQLLSSLNILSLKWGRIDVRFAQPFSLKDYIKSQQDRRGSKFQPSSSMDDKALLLQSLGFRILSEINNVSVIMPTALVGTILLTLRGRGVGRDELIQKVKWLKREIVKKGGRVADFGGMSTAEIVIKATQVLKDLISVRQELLEPVYYPNKRFDLSLYRNQVIHLFISEAVISTALYATIKAGGAIRSQRVKLRPNLIEDVSFISTLLKYEFIFSAGGLEKNIDATLDDMVKADIMKIEEEALEPGQGAIIGNEGRWVGLSKEERRIGREHFDFYCFLLWPFIETYWLAAVSLFSLVQDTALATHIEPGAWVDERVFLNRCQFFGKTIYYEGDLSYFESVNIETIKNALKRLRDNNMIITHSSVALPPRIPVQSVKRSFDQQQQKPQQDSSPNPHPAPSSPPSSSTPSAAPEKGRKTWIALHPDWVPPPLPPVAVLQRQLQLKKQRASVQTNATSASQPQAPRPPSSPSSLHPNFPLEEEKDDINLQAWYSLNPQGRLWDFCERIGRYRREGKNRRDTATVAIRVLRLARISAHWVFDAAGKKKPQPAGQQQVATVASKSKL